MGLIKDLIVNAVGEAAKEVVQDVAIGAAYGAASVGSTVFGALSKGIDKANSLTKKISEPITKKKIEQLSKECDSLFLITSESRDKGVYINVYNSSIELVLLTDVIKKNKNYSLKTISNETVAKFVQKKKLFSEYYLIELNDEKTITVSVNNSLKDKIHFEMDNGIKMIKNNILGDYDFYFNGVKIASLRSKFISNISYILSVYDNSKELEVVLLTIVNLIY